MQKHSQFTDILDMDVLKHQVKIAPTHIKPYELPGFVENVFKGNKPIQNAFFRMDEDFKNQFYQTIKFFQTDATALNNPFYIKKYKTLYTQLAHKVKQNNTSIQSKGPQIAITQADFNLFNTSSNALLSYQGQNHSSYNSTQENVIEKDFDLLTKLDIDLQNMKSSKTLESDTNININIIHNSGSPQLQKEGYQMQKHIFQHKFQMPGAGSAAIFDVDLEANPYDLVDDEFGESTKADVQPMYKLKNAQAIGKSIKMNHVNLQKKSNIININDLIDLQNVKTNKIQVSSKQLFIPLNSNFPINTPQQSQFNDDFEDAHKQEVMEAPKASIFQLNLAEDGQEIIPQPQPQPQPEQNLSQDKNQQSENKVTTDKDSEFNQILEDLPKEEEKNAQQLQEDIYKSIQALEYQQPSGDFDIQIQNKDKDENIYKQKEKEREKVVINYNQEYEQEVEKKNSVDIFEMELDGVPQVERMELLPIQIIPFNIHKPQKENTPTQPTQEEETKTKQIQLPQQEHIKNQLVEQNTIQNIHKFQPQNIQQIQSTSNQNQNNLKSIQSVKQQEHETQAQTNTMISQNTLLLKRQKPIDSIQIPKQLKIQTLPKWRQFYSKKNYECQIIFYNELKRQLIRLEYFDKIQFIEEELEVVQEIKRLSEEYSKCVDLDQEQLVHKVVKGIQKKIMALNKQQTKEIADLCLVRNGKSLRAEIYQQVCSRQPQFSDTLLKLTKQEAIPQKKLQIFIKVGIMSLCNQGSILSKTNRYKTIIDILSKTVDTLKQNIQELSRMSHDNSLEVINSTKFQQYIGGIKKYYNLCLKLSQVIKLVEGNSSFRSKMNKLRIQINTIYESLNGQHSLSLSLIQETNVTWLQDYFNPYLEYLSTGKLHNPLKICGICFHQESPLHSRGQSFFHPECWNALNKL